jgi:hypothetical protein
VRDCSAGMDGALKGAKRGMDSVYGEYVRKVRRAVLGTKVSVPIFAHPHF